MTALDAARAALLAAYREQAAISSQFGINSPEYADALDNTAQAVTAHAVARREHRRRMNVLLGGR